MYFYHHVFQTPEHVLAYASTNLCDKQDWKLGSSLRILDFPLDVLKHLLWAS